jgi:hypothetical protein
VVVEDDGEDSDEQFYEGRVFQRKECDIYVVSSDEDSESEGMHATSVPFLQISDRLLYSDPTFFSQITIKLV